MNIIIRSEEEGDEDAIYAITAEAFDGVPYSDQTEPLIVDALRNAGALTISLVAELGGAIVGHVAISPVTISDGTEEWYGLGPVSVDPDHQGRGVGTMLIEEALRQLEELGAAGCVVLGDPDFYARFDFEPMPGLILPGVSPEFFQARAFAPSQSQGTVSFHAAFSGG